MREIKFRAWDKDAEVLREYDELKGLTLDALNGSDLTLEEYTSVDDVNGNELYEGDIFRVTTDINDHIEGVARVLNAGGTFILKGSVINKMEIEAIMYGEYGWSESVAGNCVELLGNIHENPELLEKKHETE